MNPKEYEKNVLITESNDMAAVRGRVDDQMIRLLHAGVGLSSEIGELSEAVVEDSIDWVNVMEECGDLTWYTSIAINAMGFDAEEVSLYESKGTAPDVLWKNSQESLIKALFAATWAVGNYNDLLKKNLFYGKKVDEQKMKQTLQQICMSISGMCYVAGYTIADSRETNIKKLKARYKDKFTETAALARDLDAERKILEGT